MFAWTSKPLTNDLILVPDISCDWPNTANSLLVFNLFDLPIIRLFVLAVELFNSPYIKDASSFADWLPTPPIKLLSPLETEFRLPKIRFPSPPSSVFWKPNTTLLFVVPDTLFFVPEIKTPEESVVWFKAPFTNVFNEFEDVLFWPVTNTWFEFNVIFVFPITTVLVELVSLWPKPVIKLFVLVFITLALPVATVLCDVLFIVNSWPNEADFSDDVIVLLLPTVKDLIAPVMLCVSPIIALYFVVPEISLSLPVIKVPSEETDTWPSPNKAFCFPFCSVILSPTTIVSVDDETPLDLPNTAEFVFVFDTFDVPTTIDCFVVWIVLFLPP